MVNPGFPGADQLLANPALGFLLSAFAAQQYQRLRTRQPEKKQSHAKLASTLRKDCVALADLVVRQGGTQTTGWCSACFECTSHLPVAGRSRPRVHICTACGSSTSRCAARSCEHFAVRPLAGRKLLPYCAEHTHSIPSFEKLSQRLTSLEQYDQWREFKQRNVPRRNKKALAVLGGATLAGPLALLGAPAIGGAIGVMKGLSGAAATSYGLALLGGGSIASGGMGMAGGTIVVTTVGAALGGKREAPWRRPLSPTTRHFELKRSQLARAHPSYSRRGSLPRALTRTTIGSACSVNASPAIRSTDCTGARRNSAHSVVSR